MKKNNLRIEINFRSINFVSDRTARETIKLVSKSMRRAQYEELLLLVKDQQLTLSEYQSTADRLATFMQDAPLMEIEQAVKGSWKILAAVGAFGLWALQNTVGQSLTDGWKENPIHSKIVNYVKNERPEKLAKLLGYEMSKDDFSDRWVMKDIRLKSNKRGDVIIIELVPPNNGDKNHKKFIGGNEIIDEINKRLK